MYLGKIVELGPAEEVYSRSIHPYTLALLSAVPSLKRQRHQRIRLTGEPPKPTDPPPGCPFHPRCPICIPGVSDTERPLLKPYREGHDVACWAVGEDGRARDAAAERPT